MEVRTGGNSAPAVNTVYQYFLFVYMLKKLT